MAEGEIKLSKGLSQEEKDRIRYEEILRDEIRKEISAKGKHRSVWEIINSPMVIFLLSSIVLSGIVHIYSIWKAKYEKKEANKQIIEKLDTEISNRIEYVGAESWLEIVRKSDEIVHMPRRLLAPPDKNRITFAEYKDENLKSLLHELFYRVPEDEKTVIKEAIEIADQIILNYSDFDFSIGAFDGFSEMVLNLNGKRWHRFNSINKENDKNRKKIRRELLRAISVKMRKILSELLENPKYKKYKPEALKIWKTYADPNERYSELAKLMERINGKI